MDENLTNLNENIVETEIDTEDIEQNVEFEEIVEIVEAEAIEEIEITVDEAVGWVGGDNTRHYSLSGRDEPEQHPITAITGLREELNDIEALGVVCSNERNQANYYLWEDENILQENRVGYFVSACSDINEIKMCTSDNDIFGVTVDSAGFIGAQADIARDIKYGLVVTTGVVHVRCELSVEVGDYVVSNDYGCAQKNKNGYKVVGRHQIDGVEYAEITLTTPINRICKLSDEVEDLNQRMDDAETNIVAAMNIANAAYNKASEAGDISEEAIKNAIEALEKSDETADKTDKLETSVSSTNEIAVQAKTIAEGAALSAITLRNEAIENANKALQDTSELRDDFKNTTEKMDNDLQSAILDIRSLEGDLAPLAIWPQDSGIENANGVAGFVAKANEDSATLASVTKFEGEFGKSLTGFVQEATEENATVKALAAYEQKDEDGNVISKGAAGLISQVDANKSSISAIAEFNGDIAGLKSQVDKNTANVSLITSRVNKKYVVVDSKDGKLKDVNTVYYEKDTGLYWYFNDNVWTWTYDASDAGLPSSIAGIQVETDVHSSKINSLVDWQGDINIVMARIEQKADANGAYIQSTVTNIDKYSVGEYSQAYGLTLEQAASILKVGMIYVPTKHLDTRSHSETYLYTDEDGNKQEVVYNFTPGNHYIWDGVNWIEYGNTVAFFSEEPTPSDALQYWYVDSNEAPEGYEAHALYIWQDEQWQKVNILDGNVNNRITSMIRQTADKIAIDVANARGDITSHQQWLDSNSANIQDVVSWKSDVENDVSQIATIKQTANDAGASIAQVVESVGENGEVNAASIVTAINTQDQDSESFIKLNADVVNITADNINLEGYVTIESLKGKGTTEINGSNITTGAIQSNNYNDGTDGNDVIGMKLDLTDGTWDSANFKIDANGKITASGGTIASWNLRGNYIEKETEQFHVFLHAPTEYGAPGNGKADVLVVADEKDIPHFILSSDGTLKANKCDIRGGTIGGWNIISDGISKTITIDGVKYLAKVQAGTAEGSAAFLIQKDGVNQFYVTYGGKLFANNADITGTITATSGTIGGCTISNGKMNAASTFTAANGAKIGNWTISGNSLYAPNYRCSDGTVQTTKLHNGGIECSFTRNGLQYTFDMPWYVYSECANWYNNKYLNTNSDANIKNSISELSLDYEILFDNLKPKKYKYNDGTSDRYHTGFIAQEVEEAIGLSNLTTQDFAGLMHYKTPDKYNSMYGLRKDEFVALNTWQIQKAKARISELEEKVAKLEELIKEK